MTQPTSTDIYAREIKEWLPEIERSAEENSREIVQTVVWLVGLASGLLAFTVTNSAAMAANGISQVTLGCVLLAVVFLGAIQRIIQQTYRTKLDEVLYRTRIFLFIQTSPIDAPLPLQDEWDAKTIRDMLSARLDKHYSWPVSDSSHLERYRNVYKMDYEFWQKHEEQKQENLSELFNAMMGIPVDRIKPLDAIDNPTDDAYADLRKAAKSLRRRSRAADKIYYAMLIAFFAAIGVMVWGVAGLKCMTQTPHHNDSSSIDSSKNVKAPIQ